MSFEFEKELRKVINQQIIEKPTLRDPYWAKKMDHRRRYRGLRIDKKRKAQRNLMQRSFRRKNSHFCSQVMITKIEKVDILIEPIIT